MSQNGHYNPTLWKLMSLSGSVNVGGQYRIQKDVMVNINETTKSRNLIGGLQLKSENYFWHPNFLIVELDGEYNPSTNRDNYLAGPNRTEVRTGSSFGFKANFFRSSSVNFNVFGNKGRYFINREYLTSVRSDNAQLGAALSMKNKLMPLHFRYLVKDWTQKELLTGRTTFNNQRIFNGRGSKSFSKRDTHNLSYSYVEYLRKDYSDFQITNNNSALRINNRLQFGKNNQHYFNSLLNRHDQWGVLRYNRLQAFENVMLKLPKSFQVNGSYGYIDIKKREQSSSQRRVSASLSHQLYSSLKSEFNFVHDSRDLGQYFDYNTYGVVAFNYNKKIHKGHLVLGYHHKEQIRKIEGTLSALSFLDEKHVLKDGEVVLLDNSQIELASVRVKDETGLFFYDLNFDYILFEHGPYVEVQRIPGGQIPDNSAILVDYIAVQPGSYRYYSVYNSFNSGLTFFNKLLSLYYSWSRQGYKDIEATDLINLNYFEEHVYGVRFSKGIINGGFEIRNHQSSIVPFNKERYYIQLKGRLKDNTIYSINGDVNKNHYNDIGIDQLYSNIYGRVSRQFGPKYRLSVDMTYRKQVGESIDLDLLIGKSDLEIRYRALWFRFGVEFYRRAFVTNQINFHGIYFELSRRFNRN